MRHRASDWSRSAGQSRRRIEGDADFIVPRPGLQLKNQFGVLRPTARVSRSHDDQFSFRRTFDPQVGISLAEGTVFTRRDPPSRADVNQPILRAGDRVDIDPHRTHIVRLACRAIRFSCWRGRPPAQTSPLSEGVVNFQRRFSKAWYRINLERECLVEQKQFIADPAARRARNGNAVGTGLLFTADRTNAAAVGPNDSIKVTKLETFVSRIPGCSSRSRRMRVSSVGERC